MFSFVLLSPYTFSLIFWWNFSVRKNYPNWLISIVTVYQVVIEIGCWGAVSKTHSLEEASGFGCFLELFRLFILKNVPRGGGLVLLYHVSSLNSFLFRLFFFHSSLHLPPTFSNLDPSSNPLTLSYRSIAHKLYLEDLRQGLSKIGHLSRSQIEWQAPIWAGLKSKNSDRISRNFCRKLKKKA